MDMQAIHDRTIAIARAKGNPGGEAVAPCLGTGGSFADVFLWDTAFTVLWARHAAEQLPVAASLDNLYRLQDADGHINRQYYSDGEAKWSKEHPISFAPPLLSWAEWALYESSGDRDRLAAAQRHLVALHAFNRRYCGDDGLYWCDPFGCGMDNLPRWPAGWQGDAIGLPLRDEHIAPRTSPAYRATRAGVLRYSWNRQGRYIDTSAQIAVDCRFLALIASELGDAAQAARWEAERRELGERINAQMWSDRLGFYVDLGYGEQIARRHVGGFWPLLAGIVPPERVQALVAQLEDPRTFARPVPVPSLAADEPEYSPAGSYWLGSSWPCTTYMVIAGLRLAGATDAALRVARQYYRAVCRLLEERGTIYENLAPEEPLRPGEPAGSDFCGWGGLGTVALQQEFGAALQ